MHLLNTGQKAIHASKLIRYKCHVNISSDEGEKLLKMYPFLKKIDDSKEKEFIDKEKEFIDKEKKLETREKKLEAREKSLEIKSKRIYNNKK